MADLMRLSWPWLLSSTQPLRSIPSIRPHAASPILLSLSHRRGISTTESRLSKRARSRGPSAAHLQRQKAIQAEANSSFLVPMTLVPPPLSRYPRHPTKFLHMGWLQFKNRFAALVSLWGTKFMSQPRYIISRSKFKANRSAAVPTAKAMHMQMSEALAAGDKETLRAICTYELFRTLSGIVDSRPKGMRAEWELVRYDKKWYYPRLADWRLAYHPIQGSKSGYKLVKQAVVSIASVQRLARYDDTKGGVKIPGSERVRHMVEHIVLQAEVDQITYESEPWKIWGNLNEMTYEGYLADLENTEMLMAQKQAEERSRA